MPRFRSSRSHPRIKGTKKKHNHDSLHLIETARVKVNKARVRLPKKMKQDDVMALLTMLNTMEQDINHLRQAVASTPLRGREA